MNARHWPRALFVSQQPAPEPAAGAGFARSAPVRYAAAAVSAVLVGTLGGWTMFHAYALGAGTAAALAAVQSAPLLLAVRRPLEAWWIMTAADVASSVVLLHAGRLTNNSWPWPPAVLAGQLLVLVAVARRARRAALVMVWVVLTASAAALAAAAPQHRDGTDVVLSGLGGGVLLFGAVLRERHEALRRLGEQQLVVQAERARHTLLEERARIARELHDVVAHHMSVITVQADSAPYRIPDTPEQVREEFAAIAVAARHSLAEMRMLLGVLRGEDADAERAPQPGLDDVPYLAEAITRAGVPVELALDDAVVRPAGRIPPVVELSAYRIVQEALANVVRHAPAAPTRVEIAIPSGGGLSVLVVNAPAPRSPAAVESAGTGHGLVGMRERVRLLGGVLETGPTPGGGYRVAARLPLPALPPTWSAALPASKEPPLP